MENAGAQRMRADAPCQQEGKSKVVVRSLPFHIRQFAFGDAPRIVALQAACLDVCRDTRAFTAGFFHTPCFADGRNIFCAVDANGVLLGYAALCPRAVSTTFDDALELWLDLRVAPTCRETEHVFDRLLSRAIERASEIGAASLAGADNTLHRVALVATYFASARASIDALTARGFVRCNYTYTLRRDLTALPTSFPVSSDVEVYPWRLDTTIGQQDYLTAYLTTTGDRHWDMAALQRFLKSEFWAVGTTITAFYRGAIIGSALVWYDPNLLRNKQLSGCIERIFVKPEWRGQGIVQRLLNEAAAYLRRRGMSAVTLTVDDEDRLAVEIYEGAGYHIVQKEMTLGLLLV